MNAFAVSVSGRWRRPAENLAANPIGQRGHDGRQTNRTAPDKDDHQHASTTVIGGQATSAVGVGWLDEACLVVVLAVGGLLVLLTAVVPALPKPTGPHRVGSEIFRWTDSQRPETLTANAFDRRQVIAQAWYPTDATSGRAVPYFEAQGRLPGPVGGIPSFMFGSFGSVATHATFGVAASAAQQTWPVLLFSARARDPARAVHGSLRRPGKPRLRGRRHERPIRVRGVGTYRRRCRGQTVQPDVTGPPPHPAVQRLIDIRTADSSFVLDQLRQLAQLAPNSPLVGHLDLNHVGIVGHSIGGATAVQVMAGDPRFKVGVDLDGKLFGAEPDARLDRPFLWIQSGATPTAEYTQGRDRLFNGLRDGGALVTIRGSIHMSFTDGPSYLTALGRSLVGGESVGSISTADMTAMTGDMISAFVGPSLGVTNGSSFDQVIARHSAIRSDRRMAPKPA